MGVSPFLYLHGMIWETEEVKNNKNKGESEEVAGNYTHLESASCVKQFREVGFQPSRLGRQPDQERGRPLLPLSPS